MPTDALSTTLSALADPTRRAILARLSRGEASVTELASPFDVTMPAITKHLKVLERAGLISRGRDAQWRPCRLRAGPLKEAAEWIGGYRQFWEESFDRLDEYLRGLQGKDARQEPVGKSDGGRNAKKARNHERHRQGHRKQGRG